MEITNIKIENVKKGTPRQVEKGIHGKFTMDLYLSDGTHFLTLKSMTLRKTRQDVYYIQPPYETWGDGNKNKSYFYYLYPSSEDRDSKLKDLVDKVVSKVNSATPAPTATSPSPSSSSSSMGENLF